ncbi:PPC domain-containing DNA-binding protein [uncultured Methanoregula sp.]|uniref:PPC domain-containing DNA-binding protein n=1 Tax=uncultured Methanoregula sp. TaxID=1005933 RepID=UPI002AAACB5A|nr:PPC domain-containing DNA-binding protein [uncultured Methanoregula sp.]
MQYTEGQIGRVFIVRIDDGEDMLESLHRFVQDKGIQTGSILFLGALMNGRMVTGPEEPVIPPVPHFVLFEGGWEVFGVGTIYRGEGGIPHIHYHASVGRSGHALTGCLREEAVTYLIVEAVITEFTGVSARREFDQKTQLSLPVLGKSNPRTEKREEEKPVDPKVPSKKTEKKEETSELPGGLADIIRDLTRRPSS